MSPSELTHYNWLSEAKPIYYTLKWIIAMEASMSESWDDLSIEQHVNNQEQAEQLVGILD